MKISISRGPALSRDLADRELTQNMRKRQRCYISFLNILDFVADLLTQRRYSESGTGSLLLKNSVG